MKSVVYLCDDINPSPDNSTPYADEDYNDSYRHLAETSAAKGVRIIFSHYADCCDGQILKGWIFKDDKWKTIGKYTPECIYDRILTDLAEKRDVKKSVHGHTKRIFNKQVMEEYFNDKHRSYELSRENTPLTVPVNGSRNEIIDAIETIRDAQLTEDLNCNCLFVKPRYGYGGKDIIVICGDDYRQLENVHGDYVVQPFLETANGIPELKITGRHDLRLIICDGIPTISYARIPPNGGYISNQKGREIKYFDVDRVPDSFLQVAERIDAHFKNDKPRIYSVDMGRGQSGRPWIIELNGKPGLTWYSEFPDDVKYTKILHDYVAEAMADI